MRFWRHLLARSVQLVYKQPWICSPCITFSILFPSGSEAAMEAAGSLAPTYPEVFSGRMVPRLEEELQSEREESYHNHRSLQQRCLQALAAVSTHTSIVRDTVPVLLQHLQKVQKGNGAAAGTSTECVWAGAASVTGDGWKRAGMAVVQGTHTWAVNPTGGVGVRRAALSQDPGADQGC